MKPLAERLRPTTLDNYIGQKHLVGQGAILRQMVEAGHTASFILWGPPGVGKTTLAKIIANKIDVAFYTLSAVSSGVKDVRDIIESAKKIAFLVAKVLYCSLMKSIDFQNRNKIACWQLWNKETLHSLEPQQKTHPLK